MAQLTYEQLQEWSTRDLIDHILDVEELLRDYKEKIDHLEFVVEVKNEKIKNLRALRDDFVNLLNKT